MTTMLTPGYAPLEQYGQHARFGVFTDIYALGATTYQLLTGQVPIQATDRAAGVELAAPRRLNSRISRQVSDAVLWAMEMRVDKRPPTASDFVQAMRGARSAFFEWEQEGRRQRILKPRQTLIRGESINFSLSLSLSRAAPPVSVGTI